MRLTNKFNLPEPVVQALSWDSYSKGDADYSVTQLLDSPRVRALQWQHDHEIERDVTENFFSLLGRACHQILEWGAQRSEGATPEERLFLNLEVDGVPIRVSGSMDLQEDVGAGWVDISDHKVTSVLSATSDKASWEQQLNLYAHLVRQVKNLHVRKLSIIAFLRDWRRSNADRDPNYPRSPIIVIDVPIWPDEEAARFLQERIRLHMKAGDDVLSGLLPEPCTSEERWEGEAKWAVLKHGGKRALKVFDTEDEAMDFHGSRWDGFVIEKRGGEPRRCLGNWCKVAEFCDYARQLKAENKDAFDEV